MTMFATSRSEEDEEDSAATFVRSQNAQLVGRITDAVAACRDLRVRNQRLLNEHAVLVVRMRELIKAIEVNAGRALSHASPVDGDATASQSQPHADPALSREL